MPDGLTHIIVSYIGGKRWIKGYKMTLFLSGSLMPDLFLRGGRLFLIGNQDKDFLELFLVPLHTPFVGALLCYAIALLFESKIRKTVFVMLFSGCLTHFILDLMQRTINGFGLSIETLDGYSWLYPFTWFDFQIGIF